MIANQLGCTHRSIKMDVFSCISSSAACTAGGPGLLPAASRLRWRRSAQNKVCGLLLRGPSMACGDMIRTMGSFAATLAKRANAGLQMAKPWQGPVCLFNWMSSFKTLSPSAGCIAKQHFKAAALAASMCTACPKAAFMH